MSVCVCIDGRLRLCPHFHLVLRVTAPYSIANTLNPNGRQHQLLYCSRVILVCWLSWVGQLVVVCCCITSSSSSIHWLPMPLTTYVRKPIVPSYVGIHLQNNYTVQMIENRGWAHNGRCRLILKKKKTFFNYSGRISHCFNHLHHHHRHHHYRSAGTRQSIHLFGCL